MKKSLLVGIAAYAMLFSACTSSDEVPEKTVITENQIQLVLNTAGNTPGSRSARELYTTADTAIVDHVTLKLYTFVDEQWVLADGDHFESEEMEWDNTSTLDPKLPKTTNIFKLKNLNESTRYKVIAYAYNKPCRYDFSDNGNATFVATPQAKKDAEGKIIRDADGNILYYPTEELFAGESAPFQTNSEALIEELVNVEMKRMVSGLLAYFYNIPVNKILPGTTQLKPVRFINVYACSKASAFEFPSTIEVNGLNTTEEKIKVLDFDLAEWVPDYETQVTEAGDNISALFTMPGFKVEDSYLSTVPNSVIKGCFLIPFENKTNYSTVMIEFEDADNNVLKHWDVSLDKDKYFSLKRNVIYALGQKIHNSATGDEPGDEYDPDGPEGDQPLDMSGVELTISLVDSWDGVFYMTLE